MHTHILDTSKRCTFWVCNCRQNQHLTIPLCWHYIWNKHGLGAFSYPLLGLVGSIKCLSIRQRGQSTGSGTSTIPLGCCHALLNMCFTSSILSCQCIFAAWIFPVENVCIEYNHVQVMHKEFLWPLDTFMQKTVIQ